MPLADRPNTALLVIDVQNGVVANAHDRDAVVANVAAVVELARRDGVPVLWVQHSSDDLVEGSAEWEFVPELQRADGEGLIPKRYCDSFEDTALESTLAELRVGRVVVTGAQTDACVSNTLHGAFIRGYDTVLVSDAHTTEDYSEYGLPTADKVIAHTNMYWKWQAAPGRTSTVVSSNELCFVDPSQPSA